MTFARLKHIADEALAIDDPWLLIDVARAFRRIAGLDPTFPPEDVAHRLAANLPGARGFLLDSLDDAEAHLLGVEKRDRWA